jgi:hypothetical protein
MNPESKALPVAVWPSEALELFVHRTVSPARITILPGEKAKALAVAPTIDTELDPEAVAETLGSLDRGVVPVLGFSSRGASADGLGVPGSGGCTPPLGGATEGAGAGSTATVVVVVEPAGRLVPWAARLAAGTANQTATAAPLTARARTAARARPDELPPDPTHPSIRPNRSAGSIGPAARAVIPPAPSG